VTTWQVSQQLNISSSRQRRTSLQHHLIYACSITKYSTSNTSTMTLLKLREQDLTGKVAVITGASRGIGRAITLNLASRGCSILGTCSSPENVGMINSMDEEINELFIAAGHPRSSRVIGISANIVAPTCSQKITDALVEHFNGRVDIFVNNAVDSRPGVIGELTVEEIQESMISNIQTPVLIVDELVKRKMFQPESRIIYISSIRSRQPWSMQLMYSAGKSAGESLCRTWSQAFGGREEKVSGDEGLHTSLLSHSWSIINASAFVGR
jgi:3-oxoacyl-[acyl-carrier protein] reductase